MAHCGAARKGVSGSEGGGALPRGFDTAFDVVNCKVSGKWAPIAVPSMSVRLEVKRLEDSGQNHGEEGDEVFLQAMANAFTTFIQANKKHSKARHSTAAQHGSAAQQHKAD